MKIRSLPQRIWDLFYVHRLRVLTLFIGVLVPLSLFGLLAQELIEDEGFFFDEPILRFAHDLTTPSLDVFMLGISVLGLSYGVVPIDVGTLLLLLLWNRRRDALFFGLSVIGAGVLNQSAKVFFGRPRPKLWPSIAPEQTLSFPSGHAMGSMACVAALIVLLWPTRWRWPALALGGVFVILVGVSRVYLGVHFPSDILAGWGASLGWVIGLSMVFYRQPTKPTPENTLAVQTLKR